MFLKANYGNAQQAIPTNLTEYDYALKDSSLQVLRKLEPAKTKIDQGYFI